MTSQDNNKCQFKKKKSFSKRAQIIKKAKNDNTIDKHIR